MNSLLRNSTLAAIFGLTLAVWSYSLPSEAATLNVSSSMMDMDDGMMDMDLGPADALYDLRFIDAMSVHHESAIEMAQDALSKSQRSEIQQLSQDIITTQSGEITQLMQWRMDWYPNADKMDMGNGMMETDLGPTDAFYDLRFIDAMSVHHQSAIEMAQDALSKSQRPEIQQLSQDIITTQSREIAQLKQWRMAWYPDAGGPDTVAVPESSTTLGLLTLGALGIGLVLKRQRTKQKSESVVTSNAELVLVSSTRSSNS